MRHSTRLILAAALAASAGLAQAATDRAARGAAELARALEGRAAGEPVRCLPLHSIRSTRIIDGTAILFEANNGTLYVNTPRSGARSLRRDDIQITRPFGTQQCSLDIVRLTDSSSRIAHGFVSLGDFVPYRKPKG